VYHVALAGNPNSGKTTVFNALTGARQHVGNYPGVTVEIKVGRARHPAADVRIIDLPGAYSLIPFSPEERVARDYILRRRPDVVVVVLDASNLERHLFLVTHLLELGAPLVLAANMADVARARGRQYDWARMSRLLGDVPIVPMTASRGVGIAELLEAVTDVASRRRTARPIRLAYRPEFEVELAALETRLEGVATLPAPARGLAVKLLEGDAELATFWPAAAEWEASAAAARARLQARFHETPETLLAEGRYGFISGACQEALTLSPEARHDRSDRLDAVLTHGVWGLPIFLALMYAVFQLTFRLGQYPMGWLENGFELLRAWINGWWPAASPSLLRSLLADGIVGGVGGVLVFMPNILLLFLAIALLEDSGYMARAAFIMDRFMHRLGLHGKSFIPMLVGFGCSVPAIMATRIIENRRDRMITMLVIPLVSCGARFPIYALIIPAFFPPAAQGAAMWLVYLFGIALAILAARLLRATLFRGESVPFVIELPPYRMPTPRGLLQHTWERGWLYVKKAGTLILGISILLWALSAFPRRPADRAVTATAAVTPAAQQLEYSWAGRIGRALEPVFRPAGFDWRITTALLGAFSAKEVFVAQLGIVFAVDNAEEDSSTLRGRLRAAYTPLTAVSILLFCLIATPCMATLAATRRESGAWRWALFQFWGLTLLGYVLAVLAFQAGRLLGCA